MGSSVKLTKDELLNIIYGVNYNLNGSIVKDSERIRNYTIEVIDNKTHLKTYNYPIQILVDGNWKNISEVVHQEDLGLLYDVFQETHMISEIILDTDDPSPISVRSRERVTSLSDQLAEAGIHYPREFTWVDGASSTSGVIILPKDDYDKVFIATDPDKNGNPEILFVEPKTQNDQERPFYLKSEGKTYIYVDHFSGGGGTQSSPYTISTESDLSLLSTYPTAYFIQDRDIIMTAHQTGAGFNPVQNFSGYFDGRGFEIKDLYINSSGDNVGLFGNQTGGVIKRVKLTNVNVNASGNYVGALAGRCDGDVYDCAVISGTVENKGKNGMYTGGLVGYKNSGNIYRSYSHAQVKSDGDSLGGFIGRLENGSIYKSFSTGKVVDTTIAQNLSNKGGFAGSYKDKAGVLGDDNFYDTDKSGFTTSAGAAQGRKTSDLKRKDTFEGKGFDFWNEWHLGDYKVNGGYPENRRFIKYSKGKGTKEEPFLIQNSFDLEQVRHYLYANFRLETDLVLEYPAVGKGWLPIGHEGKEIGWAHQAFYGTFDGNGKSIGNLYINRPDESYCGLFRYVNQGIIKNLELVDVAITAGGPSGTVVGSLSSSQTGNGRIENCKVTKFQNFKLDFKGVGGGLVGSLETYAEVRGCTFNGPLTMNAEYAGGIVGQMDSYAKIYRSSARGQWIQYGGVFGGIVGKYLNYATGTVIEDVISAADMATQCSKSGGVFGYAYTNTTETTFTFKRVIVLAKTAGGNAMYFNAYYYSGYSYKYKVTREQVYYDQQRSSGGMMKEFEMTPKYTAEIRHPGTYPPTDWDFSGTYFFDENYSGDPNLLEFKEPELPILGFRNQIGKYYTDEKGNVLRYLDYGTLVAGTTSRSFPVWLQNNADFPVVQLKTWVDSESVNDGIMVELSLTDNPFVPTTDIVFGGTVPVGDSKKFFVRFSSNVTVQEGGTFNLKAKASPA